MCEHYFDRAYLVVDYTAQTQTVVTGGEGSCPLRSREAHGVWGYARWRGGWERVQILSLDHAFCRVNLPDYDQEDMCRLTPCFPRAEARHDR